MGLISIIIISINASESPITVLQNPGELFYEYVFLGHLMFSVSEMILYLSSLISILHFL